MTVRLNGRSMRMATRPFRTFVALAVCCIAWVEARADAEVQALAGAPAVLVAAAIVSPDHEEPNHLEFEAGRFDLVKNVQQATAFGVEYRFGRALLWKLRGFVGGGFTSQRSYYGYAGIRLPTYWGQRIVATPSFAIGGYGRGDGKDLGEPPLVGRFGIDLEYAFDSDARIGIAYHHMSNGKILGQTENPGTEVVGLTLAIPLP